MCDEVYKQDFQKYIDNCIQNNVGISNLICLNRAELEYAFQLQKQYPGRFDISFGYHPEDADKITEEDYQFLDEVADKVKGIGEIGLDYYWTKENVEKQKEMFIRQIEIANKHNKNIMIHTRNAAQDTYDILKKYAKTKVIMHCFSESKEMMNEFLKLGYYISFAGPVTFKNAVAPKENAKLCPIDRILIETDCPYLTPVPFRGTQNETAYVKYTGEYIAQLKEMDVEKFKLQLIDNYNQYWK